jgi:transcription initiation factor TFIIB
MGLPRTIRENAALIYRSAATRNLIRGRSIEGIAAAAIYAASRRCDIPRTLDEISSATNIPRKEIGRKYRYLARELELKLKPTTPHDYITRFANDLKLKGKTRTKALEILETASEKELTAGRGPTGVAAAALYIASVLCDERRTQKEVAEVSGVTEVTIRNRYKELSEKLNIEITL